MENNISQNPIGEAIDFVHDTVHSSQQPFESVLEHIGINRGYIDICSAGIANMIDQNQILASTVTTLQKEIQELRTVRFEVLNLKNIVQQQSKEIQYLKSLYSQQLETHQLSHKTSTFYQNENSERHFVYPSHNENVPNVILCTDNANDVSENISGKAQESVHKEFRTSGDKQEDGFTADPDEGSTPNIKKGSPASPKGRPTDNPHEYLKLDAPTDTIKTYSNDIGEHLETHEMTKGQDVLKCHGLLQLEVL